MRKTLMTIAAVLVAMPAFAEDVSVDMVLGSTAAEAEAKLAEMGYEIRKSDMEDGMQEYYVVKDGKTAEIYVDTATGKVAKISD